MVSLKVNPLRIPGYTSYRAIAASRSLSGIQGVQRYSNGCHCAEFSGIPQLWDSRQLILNLPLLNQLFYIGDAFKSFRLSASWATAFGRINGAIKKMRNNQSVS